MPYYYKNLEEYKEALLDHEREIEKLLKEVGSTDSVRQKDFLQGRLDILMQKKFSFIPTMYDAFKAESKEEEMLK